MVKAWTTISEYVDQRTGEMLDAKRVKQEYIIIKKTKHVEIIKEIIWKYKDGREYGETVRRGIVRWTNECSKGGKQTSLFTVGGDV